MAWGLRRGNRRADALLPTGLGGFWGELGELVPGALWGQWDEGAGPVREPNFEGFRAIRTEPRGYGLMWAGMHAP